MTEISSEISTSAIETGSGMEVDQIGPKVSEKESSLPDRPSLERPSLAQDAPKTKDLGPTPSPLKSPRLKASSGPVRKRPAKDLTDENLEKLKELWPSGAKEQAMIAVYLGRDTLDKVPPTVLAQLVRLAEACATHVDGLQAERMDSNQAGSSSDSKKIQALLRCKHLLAELYESEKTKRKKGVSSLGVRQLRDLFLREFVGVVDVDENQQSEGRHGVEGMEIQDDMKDTKPPSSTPTTIQQLLGCVLAESLGPTSLSEHRLQSRPVNLLKGLETLGLKVDNGCDVVFRRDGKVLVKPAGWKPRSTAPTADTASAAPFEVPADEEKRRSRELKLWDAEDAELSFTEPLWRGFETGQVLAARGNSDNLVCFACAGVPPLVICKDAMMSSLAMVFAQKEDSLDDTASVFLKLEKQDVDDEALRRKGDASSIFCYDGLSESGAESPGVAAAEGVDELECTFELLDKDERWRQVATSYSSAVEATLINAYRLYGGRTRLNADDIEKYCPPVSAACIVSHRQVYSSIFKAEVGFDEELLRVVPESTRLAFVQEFDTFRADFQSHPRAQWTVTGAGSFEMPDDLETGKVFTVVSGWVLVAVENLHAHDARFDEKVFTTKETFFIPSTTRYAVYHLSDTVMISEVWLHECNLTSPDYQADVPNFIERSDAIIWNVMVAIASLANKEKLRTSYARQSRTDKAIEILIWMQQQDHRTEMCMKALDVLKALRMDASKRTVVRGRQ